MKRFFLIIILFSFFAFSNAQNFNFGLSAGLIGSQVNGDKFGGFNKLGLFGGIFVNREISQNDIQMEFDFIQKGSRKNQNPDAGDYTTYIMRLSYIEIPVFYRYNLHQRLSILGGVKIAYLISAKEYDSYGLIRSNIGMPEFRNLDYSLMIGLETPVKDNFKVTFRFSHSIRAIRPNPSNVVWYLDRGQYNEVLTLALQYQFNGKK